MPMLFKGKIALDVRKSNSDWPSLLDPRAKKGSPNVLVILPSVARRAPAWSHRASFRRHGGGQASHLARYWPEGGGHRWVLDTTSSKKTPLMCGASTGR